MYLLTKTANKHKHMLTCSNFLLFSAIYQFKLPTVLFGGQPGHAGVKLNPEPMHSSTLSMFTLRELTSAHPLSHFTYRRTLGLYESPPSSLLLSLQKTVQSHRDFSCEGAWRFMTCPIFWPPDALLFLGTILSIPSVMVVIYWSHFPNLT